MYELTDLKSSLFQQVIVWAGITGVTVATDSLKNIMAVVKKEYPDLYPRLSHDGMRVLKDIAGTKSSSLHSWGIAIDIKVDGVKDVRYNDKALYGLTLIAPIFHKYGWYWGGAFRDKELKKGVYWSNEDAMHFEVSKENLLDWAKLGLLGTTAQQFASQYKTKKVQAKTPPPKADKQAPKVLSGQHPKTSTPNDSDYTNMRPLPRRPGEPISHWLERTSESWLNISKHRLNSYTKNWFR